MSNQDLIDHVNSIAKNLSDGITYEDAGMDDAPYDANDIVTGFDYICDALDIEYRVSGIMTFVGAHILVAFGGPNIWINTQTNTVEGHWWGDSYTAGYTDTMSIGDAAEEMFGIGGE
tara:strand:+ start:926 stop:1276 length:351 start_codon:yes stop_codon:yes gene_type:complete